MRKPGIHARILFSAFLMIVAATLALDLAGVHITSQFMHKRFEDRIAFLAKYLALNSEVGVLIGDRSGLKSLALNLLGEEDVARVEIMDSQNNVLVNLSREVQGPISKVETPVLFKRNQDENMVIFANRTTPFGKRSVAGTEHIGKVRIYFSTFGIEQLIRTITKQFLWISSLLTVLAVLLFYFLSRSITQEVKQMVVTAQQVGRGDLTLRAKPGRLPETKQLALAFNAMLDSLAVSRQALQQVSRKMIQQKTLAEVGKFSLMVGHEVKNPLAIIKSSLDILKKEYGLGSDNTMVGYMEDEILRLNQLIEDFLQFAKPTQPTFREVDLNGMLADVARRFEMMNMDDPKELMMNLSEQSAIGRADRDLLMRAVANIVKNAFEAIDPAGRVEIRSSLAPNAWRVEIADNGPGIDSDHKSKIFDPFFTTRAKGTGLGLAFAAQVFKSHGGYIMVENSNSGGAVFTAEIPLNHDRHPFTPVGPVGPKGLETVEEGNEKIPTILEIEGPASSLE